MLGLSSAVPASRSLRVMAALLDYPRAEMRVCLPEMREILRSEGALAAARQAELDALIEWLASADPLETEANYVQLFDRGRATSLHLFEHVHGDSRDRGPAMIDLAQTYEEAGLYLAPGELPDYLPAVLEFVSTQPPREARAFLGEMAHIFNALFSALHERESPYASVLGALLELAGEKAQMVKLAADPTLDESWIEPPVFDGCSAKGQAKPGQPQTIHLIRKGAKTGAVA
jgi:nitrate reductase delta subunit